MVYTWAPTKATTWEPIYGQVSTDGSPGLGAYVEGLVVWVLGLSEKSLGVSGFGVGGGLVG